ncbi:MAG: response regulator [Vicinamibacteria bacterium]
MPKILVIEDDLDLAQAVAETLREAGYEAETAPDGDSGLQALVRGAPDLVLCDVTLPGLDGYGVLDAIRRQPEGALLPFVFMTGRGGEENLRRGMSSGADDYVTKPFTSQTLLAAVSARLARASAAQGAAEARLDEMRRALSVLLPHELRTPLTTLLGGASFLRSTRGAQDARPTWRSSWRPWPERRPRRPTCGRSSRSWWTTRSSSRRPARRCGSASPATARARGSKSRTGAAA